MDKGIHIDMTLIDPQKACDLLDRKILLEMMTCLGFKTPVIKSFESYLSNKKFFVSVDILSKAVVSLIGGTISGPQPFLIHINDLP